MKMQLCIYLLLAALIGFGQPAAAQKISKADQKSALAAKITTTLGSRNYTIGVRTALPFGGRTVNLTSDYSLRIEGDSVFSYLPYYGRAYSVPYDGGEGLIFNGVIQDYKLVYDKKQMGQVTFTIRTEEDLYTFNLTVTPSGMAFVNVVSTNKQGIGYSGDIKFPDEQ